MEEKCSKGKESLEIHNFGPIRKALVCIGNVTVLIGTTSSGKSTVAKLWAIFNSEEFLVSYKDFDSFKKLCHKYGLSENYFKNNSYLHYRHLQVEFILKGEKFNHVLPLPLVRLFNELPKVLERKPEPKSIVLRSKELLPLIKEIPSHPEFHSLSSGLRDTIVQFLEMENNASNASEGNREDLLAQAVVLDMNLFSELSAFLPDRQSIYIPAERSFFALIGSAIFGLLRAEVAITDSILKFGSRFEVARTKFDRVPIDFLNVEYFYAGGENWIRLADGTVIRLVNSASGFQSVIPAYVIAHHTRLTASSGRNALIIEEPELNLYPNTQKAFLEYLIQVTNKTQSKLFVTTHSPYIITSLDNLIQADNAFKSHPEKESEISNIVERSLWVEFDRVTSYFFDQGHCEPTLNKENRSLGAYAIDDVSDAIGAQFEELLKIEYS